MFGFYERKQQIERIKKIGDLICKEYYLKPCEQGNCKNCDIRKAFDYPSCSCARIGQILDNANYRNQDDVIKEFVATVILKLKDEESIKILASEAKILAPYKEAQDDRQLTAEQRLKERV